MSEVKKIVLFFVFIPSHFFTFYVFRAKGASEKVGGDEFPIYNTPF
jgi:hypothetical protein